MRNKQTASISFLAAVALCLLLLALLATPSIAPDRVEAASEADAPHPQTGDDVQVMGEFSHPRLYVGGQLVIDQPGAHLGRLQISPDGQTVAVTLIPAGTETDQYARIFVFERTSGQPITMLAGHSPGWRENGSALAFEHPSGEARYDLASGQVRIVAPKAPQPRTTSPKNQHEPLTYPEVIRVAHHPSNTCRDRPDWQVDVLPFEEYVARSVPAEVPVSWPAEALAAQAVAARTYAWYQIEQGRADYDVTDWANFQMMCDQRYSASDAAVAATAGQYLTAAGDEDHLPIIAMYSAQNGHPTLDHPTMPYLRAVPDWAGLGEARWGHGYGMSQWGAQRRASVGQTYQQILGHYYTDVHLQNANDPQVPMAGLLDPAPDGYLPPGGIHWRSLVPYAPLPGHLVVESSTGLTRTVQITRTQILTYTAVVTDSNDITRTVTLTKTNILTETTTENDPLTLAGTDGVWHYPLALDGGAQVVASLWLSDTLQDQLTLSVDRTPPSPPVLSLPASVTVHTATATLSAVSGPTIGLSNGWIWQGEELSYTLNSGTVVTDELAVGGRAREARAGLHTPGYWYGPYATGFPADATYRAVFRLRAGVPPRGSTGTRLPAAPIARLDVTDRQGERLLGLRDIWASDFAAPDQYTDIAVDFHLFEEARGLEFRVQWHGEVDLALDQVQVWQLRPGHEETEAFQWPLAIGSHEATVQAVTFDGAGNASTPVSQSVHIVDDVPPSFGTPTWLDEWQTSIPITLSLAVRDQGSGLDTSGGQVSVDGILQSASFSVPNDPWAEQMLVAAWDALPDGQHSIRFQATDRVGSVQETPTYTLAVDHTRPTISATTSISSANEWFAEPVQVVLQAEDATSGVQGMAYVLDGAPFEMYEAPIGVSTAGLHALRYWAQDNAGNYSSSHWLRIGIDPSPPTVSVKATAAGKEEAFVQWQGIDGLSGVANYSVAVRRDEGTWQSLFTATEETATQVGFEGAAGMDIRVQATDRVGNRGAWVVASVSPVDNWIYLPFVAQQ